MGGSSSCCGDFIANVYLTVRVRLSWQNDFYDYCFFFLLFRKRVAPKGVSIVVGEGALPPSVHLIMHKPIRAAHTYIYIYTITPEHDYYIIISIIYTLYIV